MKKWVVILFICCFSYSNSQINHFYLFDGNNSPLNVAGLLSLAIDSSDVVWIGAQNILYKYDHGGWELIDTLLELPEGWVNDIEISGNGDIWICIGRAFGAYANGLYKYNSGWINGIPGTYNPNKIFIDELNNLWVVFINFWPHQMLWDAVGKYDGSNWEVIDIFAPAGFGELVVRNDTVFVTTFWGDLYGYADSTWQLIIPHQEWEVKKIWKYKDRMWIGGEKFGEFYGNTFTPIELITNFLDSTNSNSTSLNVEDNNILWIGTDNGHIIRFEDELEVVTEYTGNEIKEIEIDKYSNKWVLIDNIGLLIYNEDEILEIQSSPDFTVSGYLLFQNYPNPFNPSTKIQFVIPNAVRNLKDFSSQAPRNDNNLVTLKVYDVLGNEVATLVNEELPAGEYEVEFDGVELPSGIYFYQLQSNEFIQTKKMILLK